MTTPLPRLAHIPATRSTSSTSSIPWPLELRARIRDGYACRRCRALVIGDEERRAVRANPSYPDDLANVLTVCVRCAIEHERGR